TRRASKKQIRCSRFWFRNPSRQRGTPFFLHRNPTRQRGAPFFWHRNPTRQRGTPFFCHRNPTRQRGTVLPGAPSEATCHFGSLVSRVKPAKSSPDIAH
ncbi:MAG: hypothetical protein ABI353_23585, partial [Isosphaeraceae bacterium]